MNDKPFHIKMLLSELQKRKLSNPRYSLRAFSKFLGIGPSSLSRILSNSQELSLTTSRNIIKKLKINHHDCLLFIASIAEEKKLRAIKLLSTTIEESHHDEVFTSYEWMVSSSPDLTFVLDQYGRCILINESVAKFFNRSTTSIIGKTLSEIGMPSEISKKIKNLITEIFKNTKVIQVEECYSIRDDSRCFEITLTPIIGQATEVRAVTCHWRDITEKVMYEKILRTHIECGEILSKGKSLSQIQKQFLKVVTKHFADAAIIHIPDKDSVVKDGDKNLINDFLSNKTSYQGKLELGSYISVPLKVQNTTNGNMTFLRFSKNPSFTKLESEVANDLGLRLSSSFEKIMLLEEV